MDLCLCADSIINSRYLCIIVNDQIYIVELIFLFQKVTKCAQLSGPIISLAQILFLVQTKINELIWTIARIEQRHLQSSN